MSESLADKFGASGAEAMQKLKQRKAANESSADGSAQSEQPPPPAAEGQSRPATAPQKPKQSKATSAADVPTGAQDQSAPEPPTSERTSPQAPSETEEPRGEKLPLADDTDDTFSVGAYLLPEVIRAITQERKTQRSLNADVALDAIDRAVRRGDLAALLNQRRRSGEGRPKDSVFPQRRVARPASRETRRKLWTFSATQAECDVLEELVEKYGAESRSELIAVTLEARFSATKRGRRSST